MRVASRCPKCAGKLFPDYSPGDQAPELACLACGWRRVVTLTEAGLLTTPERHRDPRMIGEGRR
jgi:hypothetical protein